MVDSVPSGIVVAANPPQGSIRDLTKRHKRLLKHQRYRANKVLKKVLLAALLRCYLSMCVEQGKSLRPMTTTAARAHPKV